MKASNEAKARVAHRIITRRLHSSCAAPRHSTDKPAWKLRVILVWPVANSCCLVLSCSRERAINRGLLRLTVLALVVQSVINFASLETLAGSASHYHSTIDALKKFIHWYPSTTPIFQRSAELNRPSLRFSWMHEVSGFGMDMPVACL